MELLPITCPRCAAECEVEYYGPCQACREQLRHSLRGAAVALPASEYEPKMNVTPNAVALPDD